MADRLESLLRLRRHALGAARLGLRNALAAAEDAEREARAARQAMQAEAEHASGIDQDESVLEAFIAWLPVGRAALAAASVRAEAAEAEVARCRGELAAARAGVEAIERLIEARAASRAAAAARAEQAALDEVAAARPSSPFGEE